MPHQRHPADIVDTLTNDLHALSFDMREDRITHLEWERQADEARRISTTLDGLFRRSRNG